MERNAATFDGDALHALAEDARKHAYAPYSKFPVGAAVLTDDGTTFTGANVENVTLGLSMCAERVAAFTAIAAGYRRFRAVAVAAGSADAPPCGACRQLLAEFGDPRATYVVFRARGQRMTKTLADLDPFPFSLP